jgi:hypothetical protein
MREANKYLQGFLRLIKENTQSIEKKLDLYDGEQSFRLNQKYTKSRQRSPEVQEYSYTTSRLDEEVNGVSTSKHEKPFNKGKTFGRCFKFSKFKILL